MAVKTWTLIDVDRNIYEEELQLDGDVRVAKRRLRGGLSDGVDLVEIDNGKFSFGVVPTRGMNLWRAKMGDTNIGWTSPIRGPVHPTFVPFAEPSGLGWVEGFDELMARCGLESNGAPEFDEDGRVVYPLHGRISNKPAHRVDITQDQSTGEIAITGVVDETRFHFMKLRLTSTYRTLPGENGLRIHDEVTNLSGSPAEAQLLYHTNFGAPLLDAGASFVAPIDRVTPRNEHAAEGIANWQRYAAPQPGTEEQVYFLKLRSDQQGQTVAMLKNAHSTMGVALHVDVGQLPCFTVWKNTTALEDGYVTGLEPGTNFPNPRTFEGEQGRVVSLDGGASAAFDVRLEVLPDSASVAEREATIALLQGNRPAKIHETPQSDWCAP